ncbi:ComE operon protein 1 [Anaerolineae bacterium]|nr:ComE operon protein 1 [Anaerolineae bacterium]
MKNVLYVLVGVLAGFVLAGVLVFVSRAPAGEPILLQPAPTQAPIAVHVVGAVPRPGLYELAEGARVQDAIDAAGGLLAESNMDTLNLAALLVDGQQLVIPYQDGREVTKAGDVVDLPSTEDNNSVATSEPTGNTDAELLNLNTATQEELEALPGIGPTLAQRIIDYRDQNGFYVVEDLLNVSGVGQSTFDQIKDLVTVY